MITGIAVWQLPPDQPVETHLGTHSYMIASNNPTAHCDSFWQVLQWRAECHGERSLYTFVQDGNETRDSYTYGELDQRAKQIAGWLTARNARGERVLLIYHQGADFLAAFFGCLYAGAIAVPAYPPRANRKATRISSIVADADAKFAFTTSDLHRQLAPVIVADRRLASIEWQAIDEILPDCAHEWRDPSVNAKSTAFLQYTSGSTGDPKGVMVTHGNLLHNQQLIRHSFGQQDSATVMAGWLPLHHDMGLIGSALHPLSMGGQYVFMSPTDFVRRPIDWLKMISAHRATISGAPNSAYELCLQDTDASDREGLDLRSWTCAYNGAEPIRKSTIDEFCKQFEPYGFHPDAFCPCYGMAETTLILTGSVAGEKVIDKFFDGDQLKQGLAVAVDEQADNATPLVACGSPEESMEARVVDPENRLECPNGTIGEIWAWGPSIADGYWQKPDTNEAMFEARLASDDADESNKKRFLRTGDLGFIHGDQLYITGRIKDLIIIGGANHSPHDIEATVQASHNALFTNGGAVFSVDTSSGEQVVVVQELKRSEVRRGQYEDIFDAILQAVAAEHQLPLRSIVLVRPAAIPKTTSGKIRRQESARRFHEDDFKTVAVWNSLDAAAREPIKAFAASPTSDRVVGETKRDAQNPTSQLAREIETLEDWLCTRLSKHLRIPLEQFDRSQPLARYGISSLTAVRLADELSRYLGRNVPVTSTFDHPHVSSLAHYLVTGQSPRASRPDRSSVSNEPIAIIGMACRFPSANSPEEFWDLLDSGSNAMGRLRDRYLQLSLPQTAATSHAATRAGLLDEIDQFDPGFFMIGPKEADEIDPQQRLLLEVSWEAFENAGVAVDSLAGSRTGVFVGVSANDYLTLQASHSDNASAYRATGNSFAIAANRISYAFDLCGPSLAIDTACSSSLVAVHQACESLRAGACNMAIAGGVNLILSPGTTSCFDQAGMLSPTGACHTFSANADGYVRGEGCGAILLKRLSQAEADGDRIHCVIQGSAVNQDGKSIGLTAPNGVAQQNVIRDALADAQVEPHEIGYVEAHGTGTPLGDPIEMGAIAAVFANRQQLASQEPIPQRSGELMVGSVKTNIGHLEAAAGMAGLIKVCLSMQQQTIPAHLNFTKPSAHIDWNQSIAVPTQATAWPADEQPRLAGVSSFGFGGTNAHVIVAEAPVPIACDPSTTKQQLLTLSAKSEEALQTLASSYADSLQSLDSDVSFSDVCFTSTARRQHYRHRLALTANSPSDAAQQLTSWAVMDQPGEILLGDAGAAPDICWAFSGQGGVFPGAGLQLAEHSSAFAEAIERCSDAMKSHWPVPLKTILWEDDRLWRSVDVQPAAFCLQVALTEMWKAWGIRPNVVLGHSLGEYAAAHTAGVFGLDDALKLVCHRANLIRELSEPGAMLAVLASEEQVQEHLPSCATICIAAINGPRQTVVAGEKATLESFRGFLRQQGIRAVWLQTTHGFHSPLIEPILDRFEEVADQVQYETPSIPFLSSVLGDWATDEVANANYWRRNLREMVRFYPAAMKFAHGSVCMEMGAGATLTNLLKVSGTDPTLTTLPGIGSDEHEWSGTLSNLGHLYVAGASPDWKAVIGSRRRVVALPGHPMQKSRHWFDTSRKSALARPVATPCESVDPLLGMRLDLATNDMVFQLDLDALPYLAEHRIESSIVFPTAVYLEIALAIRSSIGDDDLELTGLDIESVLSWSESDPPPVQLIASPSDSGFTCRVLSQAGTDWQLHACWHLTKPSDCAPSDQENEVSDRVPGGIELPVAQHYQRCLSVGLNYGPSFQGLRRLVSVTENDRCDASAWGEVVHQSFAVDHQSTSRLASPTLHPGSLDACLQVVAGLFPETIDQAWLPTSVGRYQRSRGIHPGEVLKVFANRVPTQDAHCIAVNLNIVDSTGNTVAQVDKLTLRPLGGIDTQRLAYHESWVPNIRRSEVTPVLAGCAPSNWISDIHSSRDEVARRTGLASHMDALEELETVSAMWVDHALLQLNADFQLGDHVATESLAKRLGILVQHHRLLNRMLSMLEATGVLKRIEKSNAEDQPSPAKWQVLRPLGDSCPKVAGEALLSRHPQARFEVGLVQRCGANLAEVLCGQTEPLKLLFPEDDSVSATDVYRASPGGQTVNQIVGSTVGQIADRLPEGRGLRILEIGAGTGATTQEILKKVDPRRTKITFTDVSPSFLNNAKNSFADHNCIDYRLLDIERSPASQGFQRPVYDLIVASNVLHATADLSQSIKHARELLAPGGMLVVVEGTRPVGWLDITFGLTPGWWRFEDIDRRSEYPLITTDGWSELLDEHGFHDTTVIDPIAETASNRSPENSVIIAKVGDSSPADSPRESKPVSARRWAFVGGPAELSDAITKRLDGPHEPTSDLKLATDVVFMAPISASEFGETPIEQTHALNTRLLDLVQTLDRPGDRTEQVMPRLWIVTQGAHPQVAGTAAEASRNETALSQATMGAWIRTLKLERPDWSCRVIDLAGTLPTHQSAALLADELLTRFIDDESEVVLRDGIRMVRRLIAGDHSQPSNEAIQLGRWEIQKRGSIDGLHWVPVFPHTPGPHEITVDVRASGLNFRDVINTLGLYPEDVPLGAECTGVVSAIGPAVRDFAIGDRVAVVAANSFCDRLTVPAVCACRIPDDLSFSDAATIPVAFLTASKSLEKIGQMRRGSKVLIHAATGGVGLACVQLAKSVGAEIFATCSAAKSGTLRELGIKHIYDSREVGFAQSIQRDTNGAGVDIIVNSLSEEFIHENLSSLSHRGVYVEIAKPTDGFANRLAELRPDVTMEQVDLARDLETEPASIQSLLAGLMTRIESGLIEPLPAVCFDLKDAREAFRTMRRANHIGKLLLTRLDSASAEECVPTLDKGTSVAVKSPAPNLPSGCESLFRPDANYVIAGGLGGLGLYIARWMSLNGARHIALLSRKAPTPEQGRKIEAIVSLQGCDVSVHQVDLGDRGNLSECLAALREKRSIAGVFQFAGVLDNGLVSTQTKDSFGRVLAPKVDGAWNLHLETLGDTLDHFSLFSSAAAALGSPGQANHAAANAFLDGLAWYRRSINLPAQSINWGPWSQIGAAQDIEHKGVLSGIESIDPISGLAFFQDQLKSKSPHGQVVAIDLDVEQLPPHVRDLPMLSSVLAQSRQRVDAANRGSRFLEQYQAAPIANRRALLLTHLQALVANALGLAQIEQVRVDEALFDLGLDSLTSLEVRNQLQSSLGISIPSTILFDYPTPNGLADYLGDLIGVESVDAEEVETEANEIMRETAAVSAKEVSQTVPTEENDPSELESLMQSIHHLSEDLSDWSDQDEELS